MNRKPVSLIVVFALLTLNLLPDWPAQTKSIVSVEPAGPDLYIKDTPSDTGVEPNPDTGPMWVTEDIWVRTTPDPGYQPFPFPEASPPWSPLPHENPEYRDPKFSVPNYVYVRVRNRGTSASTGTEQLRLYWAKASTGLSWPTQWGGAGTDFMANTCGPTKQYGAEVTKPRKNAGRATAAERAAYINAILNIGQPAFTFPAWGSSYWHKQQEVHSLGPLYRHGTPAFLPWHREFVNRYEALLREFDPTVKLLYWDWTTDPENSTNGFNLFTSSFMGTSGRGTGGTSIAAPFNPATGTTLAPPSVTRNLSTNTTPPADADSTLMGKVAYGPFAPSQNAFAWDLEKVPNHNSEHGYIGGGGDMSFVNASTRDPFFFLLHGNVDRLWAQWQRNVSNLSRLDPATAYDSETSNANITTTEGPWDGSGTTIQPWTAAGGYIVSKTAADPSIVSPPIYDCARLVIPVLQPGEAVVLQIPWFPPNPADFACFGGDQGHFCLLGRIETGTAAPCEDFPSPFGMTFPEGTDVNTNTRNNNNIAWKNITVVDNFPGALRLTSILIRNAFRERVPVALRFAETGEIGSSFFEHGRLFLILPPELFRRWREGGMKGRGLKRLSDQAQQRIEITSAEAFLENIRLDPGETFSVDLQFEIPKNYRPLRNGAFPKFDLIQIGAPGKPDAVVGGQRFVVDLSKIVLVKARDFWRYLDTGETPSAKWTTLTFDDTKWKTGQAELGFGSNPMTTINPGPQYQRRITTFFRHTFNVEDPTFYRSLILRLKRDDGAVVYLNGKEISRTNLPAGVISPTQLATRDVSGLEREVFFPIPVNSGLLSRGRNVVAVEVHLSSPRSDDLTFDLELLANPAFQGFAPDVGFGSTVNAAMFQRGEPIPINLEAIDTDGKITSVSVFADGKLISRSDRAPFAFQWRDAPLGVHRLRAVAMDADRQSGEAFATISVVRNLPPVVQLTSPRDELAFRAGQPIFASARASDRLGKIDRVEFFIRDDQLFASLDRLAGTAKSPPYAASIKGLRAGHYMLLAIAWDNQGLAGSSVPVHFEVRGQH
jgi:Common central domain of tyrosinase/Bacterial Ig domain